MPIKRVLGRPTVEAYGGMALAIVLGVVPMTWWMKCILLFVFFGLVVDLLARSEWTYGFSRKHKLFLCVVAALAVSESDGSLSGSSIMRTN
jgi:hypothetical protein